MYACVYADMGDPSKIKKIKHVQQILNKDQIFFE